MVLKEVDAMEGQLTNSNNNKNLSVIKQEQRTIGQTRTESLQDVLKSISKIEIDAKVQKVWHHGDSASSYDESLIDNTSRFNWKSKSLDCNPIISNEEEDGELEEIDIRARKKNNMRLIHRRSRSEFYQHSWDYTPGIHNIDNHHIDQHHDDQSKSSSNSSQVYDQEIKLKLNLLEKNGSKEEMEMISPRNNVSEDDMYTTFRIDPYHQRIKDISETFDMELNLNNIDVVQKEVIFSKDIDGNVIIKAASPDYLIESLTRDTVVGNYYYVDIVILTHSTFIDSRSFLDKLIAIYERHTDNINESDESVIKARSINAIKKWVKFNEVDGDVYLSEKIILFAKSIISSNNVAHHNWAKQIIKDLEKNTLLNSPKPDMHFPRLKKKQNTLSLIKKSVDFNNISFCDIHPLEFSRHITAGDWRHFRKIKPSELIDKAWNSDSKSLIAPNIVALIERFNRLCYWVASEIVSTIHPKQRVLVLERFIDMAKGFLQLRNYHALVAMFTAFNMNCVQKLKSTWKSISKKHLSVVKEIDNIFDSKANFKVYRSLLRMSQPPVIPFEGIFLSDVTFIYENPDKIEGLVNFEKANMLGELLRTIKTMQNFPYPNLVESAFLTDFLKKSTIMNEDQLYEMSLLIRNGNGKDGIKKRSRTMSK